MPVLTSSSQRDSIASVFPNISIPYLNPMRCYLSNFHELNISDLAEFPDRAMFDAAYPQVTNVKIDFWPVDYRGIVENAEEVRRELAWNRTVSGAAQSYLESVRKKHSEKK